MDKIGKYQILEKLGQGGMGVVYKALDTLIERVVAVKTVASNLDSDPELRARFFREGRSAGQLSHKNIVTIFDLGEDNGMAYIAMEYLEGEDLRERIQKGEPLELAHKVQMMREICEGLAHAHEKNVVHRDMKPANIFVTRTGQTKILDFGLARTVASDLTTSGHALGTPNYMSPEQVRGEKVDLRTDIFSVGVLFYELLTHKKAFQGDSFTSTIFKILQNDPEPIEQIIPDIPPELCTIVYKALAKDREQRYQTLDHMLEDIDRFCGYCPIGADPAELPEGGSITSGREIGSYPRVAAARAGMSTSTPRGIASGPRGARLGSNAVVSAPKNQDSKPRTRQVTPPKSVLPSNEEATQVEAMPQLDRPKTPPFRNLAVGAASVLAILALFWTLNHKWGQKPVGAQGNPSTIEVKAAPAVQPPPAAPAGEKPAPEPDPEVAGGIARASEALSNRQFVLAAKESEGVLKLSPDNPEALSILKQSGEKLDLLRGSLRKANSYMSAGDIQRARIVLNEALSTAPDDPEALRLSSHWNQLARQGADLALTRVKEAKSKAAEAHAPSLAAQTFGAAQTADGETTRLYEQGKFVEAASKSSEAVNLYARAERESRAATMSVAENTRRAELERQQGLLRAKSESSRQGYEKERDSAVLAGAQEKAREQFGTADRTAASARARSDGGDFEGAAHDFDSAAAGMRQAHNLALEANRREAAKPVEPPKPAPPAVVSAQPPPEPHESVEAIQKAINGVAATYKAAMEGKDFTLLKNIWPGLTAQQEQSYKNQWAYTRSLRIVPNNSKIIRQEGDSAVLTVQLHNEQEMNDGKSRRWDQKATFSLSRKGSSWIIESASFEALR